MAGSPIFDGGEGASTWDRDAVAPVPALQTLLVMRVVAAVAMACLLGNGCSALVKKPSGTSVMSDFALGGAVALYGSSKYCHATRTADLCYGHSMTTVLIGAPLALIGVLVGVAAIESDDRARDQPAEDARATVGERSWDGGLPERPTDAMTLELARQVRAAVRTKQCDAARAAMDGIAARDAEYHIAMLAAGALGACE